MLHFYCSLSSDLLWPPVKLYYVNISLLLLRNKNSTVDIYSGCTRCLYIDIYRDIKGSESCSSNLWPSPIRTTHCSPAVFQV